MNNELIWKGDSISRQRFAGASAPPGREVQVWISCRAHIIILCSLLFLPSGSSRVGRKVKRKTWIQPWESQVCCQWLVWTLSPGRFDSERKDRVPQLHLMGLWHDTRQHHPLNDNQSCVQPSYPLLMLSSQANPPPLVPSSRTSPVPQQCELWNVF